MTFDFYSTTTNGATPEYAEYAFADLKPIEVFALLSGIAALIDNSKGYSIYPDSTYDTIRIYFPEKGIKFIQIAYIVGQPVSLF